MENSSNLPQRKFYNLTLDEAMEYEMKRRSLNDPNIDMKKIRRNVSNRRSAQRSRVKMVTQTRAWESQAKDLEEQISVLTQQVASWTEKKKQLQLENDFLRQELDKRSNESWLREMEIEETRAGIRKLKGLEETAQKRKHAADSETDKILVDFHFEVDANYPNINFYQLSLQNHKGTSSSTILHNITPNSANEQSAQETQQVDNAEKTNQLHEFEDVDQYINFDALDAAGPFDNF